MAYEIIDIPLSGGLNTKADEKGMNGPGLLRASDVQFDDTGGIQTRPQYQAILSAAGNTISDIRKVVAYGDELVAFSKDKLWSYSSGDGLWTERAEYLAVKVDEKPRFVSTAEQFDCDRIEKDGIAFFCWSETTPSGTESYVAAIDVATGAVKLSPTIIKVGATRARLVQTTNRVCLVYAVMATPALWVRMYDPGDLSSSETSLNVSGLVAFDLIQDPNTEDRVVLVASRATQYTVARYSEAPAQVLSSVKARTADGAIAVASDAIDANRICVVRSNGAAIRADILDDSFGDQSVSTTLIAALGAVVNQISAIYDGASECRVFVSSAENAGTVSFGLQYGAIDNSGAAGATEVMMRRVGLASHAFMHDGSPCVWVAFASESSGFLTAQLQNSYFLLRVDGLIVAKAVNARAGGFCVSTGALPGVQEVSSGRFVSCATVRGIVPLGQDQRGYSARSPQEVSCEFDSNQARRTAQLGKTLYIAGGFISQYDGRSIVEVGFHTFAWDLGILPTTGASLSGTYNWKQSYSWPNAKGELERSTTATIFDQIMSTHRASIVGVSLHLTAKTGASGECASEFWRQIADAPVGAPFFLVTSKDPSATGDNGFVENDPGAVLMPTFNDDLADSSLISREPFPENAGGTLASLTPPGAAIIIATQDRILLATRDSIRYSKLRGVGEIAAFHDRLFVDLPSNGGPITSLAFLGETLIVFKEAAIYALPGDGHDNAGGGQNYGPARVLPADVGAVSHEAVVLTPKGLLFKSFKGWYLLGHGWQVQYVGGAVADFDDEQVLSMEIMKSQHQVRILTDSRTLVWDYLLVGLEQDPTMVGQWASWEITGADAVMWNGVHLIVNSAEDRLLAQASDHSGVGDLPQLDVETGWIRTGGLQGMGLVRRALVLGEHRGAHDLRVRVAYNYDDEWIDDKTKTIAAETTGPLQFEHGLSRPKCESVKFRITAQAAGGTTPPTTMALNLTGISLEIKRRRNHFGKGLSAARRQ